MRAVLMQDAALKVQEIQPPELQQGEVLVDVLRSGICGTDVHWLGHAAEWNLATQAALGIDMLDLSKPVVFGHEFVGKVVRYGPKTLGRFPVGTRVVSMPLLLRAPAGGIGVAGVDRPGSYAEQIVLSEDLLIEVPSHVSTNAAALTEPLAVALHVVNLARLQEFDVPLVVGCGPIGLAIIAVLRMRGVGPIVAADYSLERRELAERLGADVVVDPVVHSPYEAWVEAAKTDDPNKQALATTLVGQLPYRPTVGFECVGLPGVINELVVGAPARSRIIVAGVCMSPDRFEPVHACLKELEIRFSMSYTADEFVQAFAHIASGELVAEAMITRTIGLDDVERAFGDLSKSPVDAKILIDPAVPPR